MHKKIPPKKSKVPIEHDIITTKLKQSLGFPLGLINQLGQVLSILQLQWRPLIFILDPVADLDLKAVLHITSHSDSQSGTILYLQARENC